MDIMTINNFNVRIAMTNAKPALTILHALLVIKMIIENYKTGNVSVCTDQ